MLSFKQFDFPPADQNNSNPFDPSTSTKMFWLYTKKNELNFGITLPGLCETAGYSTQMLAFFGILILEFVPTFYGIEQGLLWQAVVAAIFVDIFLALTAHWWHDKILLSKNQLVVTIDPISRQNLKRKISKHTLNSNIFYFLIFLSGCIKSFLFYKAYIFFDAIVTGVIVCYLLGAILHITYTGYFLYTSRFYWFVNKEYKIYLETNQANNIGRFNIQHRNSQPINTDGTNIQFSTISRGLHRIYKDSNGVYFFDTLGIMTDKELSGFIEAQQNSIARDVIAREGLARQLLSFRAMNVGTTTFNAQNLATNNFNSTDNQSVNNINQTSNN
jgi:hypothetical protein